MKEQASTDAGHSTVKVELSGTVLLALDVSFPFTAEPDFIFDECDLSSFRNLLDSRPEGAALRSV